MTRHVMVENFVSRDVSIYRGELVIVLEPDRLPTSVGNPRPVPEPHNVARQVFVKTRHGRKVRVPLSLLSREHVVFNCPLCDVEPQANYADHVRHLVHAHLESELRMGLDTKGAGSKPACPFPGCHGLNWPDTDTLLIHYASDHHVLDKIMMYETEVAVVKIREQLRQSSELGENLSRENKMLREDVESKTHGAKECDKEASVEFTMQEKEQELERLHARLIETASIKDSVVESAAVLKDDIAAKRKEVADGNLKIAELSAEVKILQSKLSRGNDENKVSSSGGSINAEEALEELNDTLERMTHQNNVLSDHNSSLRKEVDNVYAHNDNLKSIIQAGKATVEAARKLSRDLTAGNKIIKDKDSKDSSPELKNLEKKYKQLKDINDSTEAKYDKLKERGKEKSMELATLHEQCQLKNEEIKRLQSEASKQDPSSARNESRRLGEKYNDSKSIEAKKDLRTKLVNCREELSKAKDEASRKDKDYRLLMAENKQHAQEIKTLKFHLQSQREVVIEKAVVKDEILATKSELEKKSNDLDAANSRLSKVSAELDAALLRVEETKVKCNENTDSALVTALKHKLKVITEEKRFLQNETDSLRADVKSLKDQRKDMMEKCSTLENEVLHLRTDLSNLPKSVDECDEQKRKFEEIFVHCKSLEGQVKYLADMRSISDEENGSLKLELDSLRQRADVGIEATEKYNLQMGVMTELMKKHERMAAQLRRKDWEIVNYQSRLDAAFEVEMVMSMAPPPTFAVSYPEDIAREVLAPNHFRGEVPQQPGEVVENVLDLSVKPMKGTKVKVEAVDESTLPLRKRTVSDCSTDDNAPSHSNLDTSHDSDSTCPSEAARLISPKERKREVKKPRLHVKQF